MGKSQRVYRQRSVSQQQQDFCGLVREEGIIVDMSLVVLSVDFQQGLTEPRAAMAGIPPGLPGDVLSNVVEQAAVKEGLNGSYGPNVVLVLPPFDEGNEPGGVQVCAVMTRRR